MIKSLSQGSSQKGDDDQEPQEFDDGNVEGEIEGEIITENKKVEKIEEDPNTMVEVMHSNPPEFEGDGDPEQNEDIEITNEVDDNVQEIEEEPDESKGPIIENEDANLIDRETPEDNIEQSIGDRELNLEEEGEMGGGESQEPIEGEEDLAGNTEEIAGESQELEDNQAEFPEDNPEEPNPEGEEVAPEEN